MSSDERRSGIHRRDFLFRTSSGIALGVAATVCAAGSDASAAENTAPAGAVYRETAHVLRSYDASRF